MAYHMLVASDDSPGEPLFDEYLGTATSIDQYWESVGRQLSLPIVASITDRADSEMGFAIEKEDLLSFKNEISKLEEYWKNSNTDIAVPDEFFIQLDEIKRGINVAISNSLKLIIG